MSIRALYVCQVYTGTATPCASMLCRTYLGLTCPRPYLLACNACQTSSPPIHYSGRPPSVTKLPHACAGRVKTQLAACGLSAAWRMGRWEAVDGYLHHMQTGPSEPGPRRGTGPQEAVQLDAEERWEGRLGRLLSDVHHR